MYRVPITGGQPQLLYERTMGRTIAVEGDQIYWVGSAPPWGGVSTGGVFTGPAAGGTARALALSNEVMGGMAVDEQYVYWTAIRSVWRVPKTGRSPEQIISCAGTPFVMRVDSDTIYYRNWDGEVWARGKSGGEPRKLSAGNPDFTTAP